MELKFTFEDGSEAIAHYGVKGMKWGVWNEETRLRYEGVKGQENVAGGGGGWYEEEEDENGEEKTSDLELEMMAYYADQANAEFLAEHPDAFPLRDHMETADESMEAINPPYDAVMAEYNVKKFFSSDRVKEILAPYGDQLTDAFDLKLMKAATNCASCSVVYDLRRRGYDVDAKMTENLQYITSDIGKYYAGAKFKPCSTKDDLERDLKAMPNGARGVLGGITVHGGGHAVTWEKENGRIVYRDCQNGKRINDVNDVYCDAKSRGKLDPITYPNSRLTLDYVRLDDKKPNLRAFYEKGITTPSRKKPNNSTTRTINRTKYTMANTMKAIKTKQAVERLFKK